MIPRRPQTALCRLLKGGNIRRLGGYWDTWKARILEDLGYLKIWNVGRQRDPG
jgi:2-methylisocitrate lyase-like PEP mutase family enzyme